jgi:hypothetical protein
MYINNNNKKRKTSQRIPLIPTAQEGLQEDQGVKASPNKVNEALSQKQYANKRTGDIAQVVEGLSTICEALTSIPTTKKKKLQELSPRDQGGFQCSCQIRNNNN